MRATFAAQESLIAGTIVRVVTAALGDAQP
jgi:hypothetical protein